MQKQEADAGLLLKAEPSRSRGGASGALSEWKEGDGESEMRWQARLEQSAVTKDVQGLAGRQCVPAIL